MKPQYRCIGVILIVLTTGMALLACNSIPLLLTPPPTMTPTITPTLPPPTSTPTGGLAFETIAKGSYSIDGGMFPDFDYTKQPDEVKVFVINSRAEIEPFISEATMRKTDFDKEFLVAAFRSPGGGTCHDIAIKHIVQERNGIKVYVHMIDWGANSQCKDIIVYPFHIVRVKRSGEFTSAEDVLVKPIHVTGTPNVTPKPRSHR